MKQLIVNADDLGYTKEINKGIMDAHKNGVVKSATVLVNREAFDDAVSLLADNPGLSTGLHIDLDSFLEIKRPGGFITGLKFDALQISDEIIRQLDKFLNAGLELSHLDSHHHAHLLPEILPIVIAKAKELNVPIRFAPVIPEIRNRESTSAVNSRVIAGIPRPLRERNLRSKMERGCSCSVIPECLNRESAVKIQTNCETADPRLQISGMTDKMRNFLDSNNIKYPPHFINGWYWGNIDEEFETAELITHPGYGQEWREKELAVCCDSNLKAYLEEKNIQLISFDQL